MDFSPLPSTEARPVTLYETKSLTSMETYQKLLDKAILLGKKLNLFLQSVQRNHQV
jgi:hypothetical protein